MKDARRVIEAAYAAFNQRDIDAALALMTDEVCWPKASEGGAVVGKNQVRAYWTRQWAQFDPRVEPLAMSDAGGGTTRVTVHQRVRSFGGTILSDSEVVHVFTLRGGLIAAMTLGEEPAAAGPSAAFAPHR
jgi:hypothetical protein